MTDSQEIVTWRGEYDPATSTGAVRFIGEAVLAPAIMLRSAMHTWGTLLYASDRETVRDDLEARWRPIRFAVTSPDVPVRTKYLVRSWASLFALAFGLVLWTQNGVGASSGPALETIAAVNWGLLLADPFMFAAERRLSGGT